MTTKVGLGGVLGEDVLMQGGNGSGVLTSWLRGQKVILRPYAAGFSEAELRRLYAWNRDEEVLRWSGGHVLHMPFDEFKEIFLQEQARPIPHRRVFAMLTFDGELIGRIGCFDIEWRRRQAELGVVIGEKAYWGRGYGRDAVETLLHHVFTETDLERIYLFTYVNNRRAQRCFSRCGFRVVGTVRSLGWGDPGPDELQMEITRRDWQDRRQVQDACAT